MFVIPAADMSVDMVEMISRMVFGEFLIGIQIKSQRVF